LGSRVAARVPVFAHRPRTGQAQPSATSASFSLFNDFECISMSLGGMTLADSLQRCSGPLDRRTWLKVGGLSLGALCAGQAPHLAQVLAAAETDRDFAVILFWANGGPSHL